MVRNLGISANSIAGFGSGREGIRGIDDRGVDDLADSWSAAHANFLSSLSPIETGNLLKFSRQIDLKPRDQLFRAGDRSNDVYIVGGGCIRLYQVSLTGRETILWLSFPGEIFGIAGLWSGSEREIHAVANEASRVYSIRRSDFAEFLGTHPEVSMRAIGILSARVRTLGHALVGLATDNVEMRIARLLVRFAAVTADTPCSERQLAGELCVNVRLTHQDIANLIGASRQTVTSTLTILRKRGTVQTVNQHIHIIQPAHLRRMLALGAA
ncbi:MAG TPA: Crp/Fnr family transcriptional regulator [Rhodospirillales bacterium]|nr:Crp/Fnr family transcriptional regulator [Rhodospirillales bacterium]